MEKYTNISHLPEGTLLNGGRFKILRFLSQGGFGCTYEAVHLGLGMHYAIKEFFVADFCNRDAVTHRVTLATESKRELIEKLKRKFADEAKAVAAFNHPNVVRVTDIFEENDTSYFVMDYIRGRSVAEIIHSQGAMTERRAVNIILQICDALEYVHNRNRLHLDIKPGNIMVDDNDHATLIDFGVSKQYDEVGGENTSTLLGYSKGYASPEQMSGNVKKFGAASDIYSLGATLYKMLTGITPLDINAINSGDKLEPLPANTSEPVKRAVQVAMNPVRLDRPQTIADFRALLTSATPDIPVQLDESSTQFADKTSDKTEIAANNKKPNTPPTPAPQKEKKPSYQPPVPPRKKKNVGMIIGIGSALVAAAVLFILLLGSKGDVSERYDSSISDRPIKTFTVNGASFTMIPVDGGTFQMGSNNGFDDEKPVHSVTLSDYYIGETEVTQELWEAVMGDNRSFFKGNNRPVENVRYYDCIRFINKLNGLTGQEFRLPTEAEWEYAARGGKRSHGYKYSGSDNIDSVAWYGDNSGQETHPVGSKAANELGIYDMTGNVLEWCSDWYGHYSSSSQSNPTGPASGSNRVPRGGGWGINPASCRVANRYGYDPSPSYRNYYLGLRLALSSYR